MDELFSCRNCIHNCGQSLLIGRGNGFCLRHASVLPDPVRTTCKYLHRKDLPRFLVDEGIREHAAEFAGFSGMADLLEHTPVGRVPYSERFVWESRTFDPVTQSLAQYYKAEPRWVLIQGMSGGVDGRRSLAHGSLVRRYMDTCGTWRSSYRFVLALIEELPVTPVFRDADLNADGQAPDADMHREALWDVFFNRLSAIQEYGFHAGQEALMWATDSLNGGLASLDWKSLSNELEDKSREWTGLVIRQADEENVFFVQDPSSDEEKFSGMC
ncbi:MAG: hypothetical protein ACLFOY_04745 [Desulfatibacillaceae bacterium]